MTNGRPFNPLLPFVALSLLLHLVLVAPHGGVMRRAPETRQAGPLTAQLMAGTRAQEAPLPVPPPLPALITAAATGPRVERRALPEMQRSGSPSGSNRSGLIRQQGTATLSLSSSRPETINPFWEANYGHLPGPAATPPEVLASATVTFPDDLPPGVGEASVVATVIVDPSGRAENVMIDEGMGAYAEHTLSTLYDMQFVPGTDEGKPVRHYLTLRIDYLPLGPSNPLRP